MKSSLPPHSPLNPSDWEAILFDFDGVILESNAAKADAFALLYKPFGEEIAQKVREHHLKNGGMSRFEKFRLYHATHLGISLTDSQVKDWSERFSEVVFEQVLIAPWVPGIQDFLKALPDSLPRFVVSATPEKELRAIADKRGLNPTFSGIYGSPKKKDQIVAELLLQNRWAPSRVLMFGDSLHDHQAAMANDIQFVARLSDLTASFPAEVAVIKDFTEVSVVPSR